MFWVSCCTLFEKFCIIIVLNRNWIYSNEREHSEPVLCQYQTLKKKHNVIVLHPEAQLLHISNDLSYIPFNRNLRPNILRGETIMEQHIIMSIFPADFSQLSWLVSSMGVNHKSYRIVVGRWDLHTTSCEGSTFNL